MEGIAGCGAILDHHHDAGAVRPVDAEAQVMMAQATSQAQSRPVYMLPRPKRMTLSGKRVLILGLGDTGLSVARWVDRQGGRVRVADTRAAPPRLESLSAAVPSAETHCGAFSSRLLGGVDLLCVSPGLSLDEAVVRDSVAAGTPVCGDIELFAWALEELGRTKVAAITGTNGKTTVTSLTAHLLRGARTDAEAAGNIGPPVLDALCERLDAGKLPAAWVLELSSYQLETCWSLAPDAATVLNLSEDHLDRYPSLPAYGTAKARIFNGSRIQVLNRDDAASLSLATGAAQGIDQRITFGLDCPPGEADFGCLAVDGAQWIAQGRNALLPVDALPIHGWHNAANAMAALALAHALGAPLASLVEALATFRGLPHRLEKVATIGGVDYFDDSKGTNVGATIAALRGIATQGPHAGKRRPVILIAGGVGKGQDFAPLAEQALEHARRVLLIGEDALRIQAPLAAAGVPVELCESLEQAVARAAREAHAGDAVLLSPACASFDMFRDYKHRGDVFAARVRELERGHG
jgi:UDP-N-acetylmuramoylalanine--D-glutamate ligase